MADRNTFTIKNEVINKAITFIFENLDEDITVDDVAKHCSYSKYHLMRLFKENTEEALYQFIRRVRLERSAWRLKVEKSKTVTEIGRDCGYSSSNYATAFRKHLNVSPADFRKNSEQDLEKNAFAHGISLDDAEKGEGRITVEYLESFFVIYERKKGNYHDMAAQWCEFVKKYGHLANEDTLYIECTIDDPSISDEDRCLYELCQTVPPSHPALRENSGIMTHTFEGGMYAVYHFSGYPQFLFMVYQEMFCRWLAKTENQLDDRPILDIYRYIGEDGYMEIDICFPLKQRA